MIDTIYIEREVAAHPRAQQICARFPEAVQIACDRYGEIFNRKAQNFRPLQQIQKDSTHTSIAGISHSASETSFIICYSG